MKRYTLIYEKSFNIDESNNKQVLIARARKTTEPATVVDERCQGIIYENKAQRIITNRKAEI